MVQGSNLSPTLFTIYTNVLEDPEEGCINVIFADDITQIITHPSKSKDMIARRSEREIRKVNDFENKWKIKTNKNKFQMLSISASKPGNVTVDGERYNYTPHVKVLGLKIGRCGVSKHIGERIGTAKATVTKLKRFKKLKEKTKIHLYKTLVRPVLEYPAIPNCICSKTNMYKLQAVQNKFLRTTHYQTQIQNQEEITNLTAEELHKKY